MYSPLIFILLSTAFGYDFNSEEDFFVYHIRNYLNHSVEPCQDMYAHVCSKEIPKKDYFRTVQDEYIAKIDHVKDMPTAFKNIVQLYTKLTEETEVLIKESNSSHLWELEASGELETAIKERCQQNMTRCLQYYRSTVMLSAVELPLREDGQALESRLVRGLFNYFKNGGPMHGILYSNVLELLNSTAQLHGFLTALERPENQDFTGKFNAAQLVASFYFRQMRDIYLSHRHTSPWIKEKNLVDFHEIIDHIRFRRYILNQNVDRFLGYISDVLKNCTESMFGFTDLEVQWCLQNAYVVGYEKFDVPWFYSAGLKNNAFFNSARRDVVVLPPNLSPFLKNGISFLVNVGLTVGHELGHHFFNPLVIETALMPQNLKCLAEHRAEICKLSTEDCWSGNQTLSEDASDVVGLAVLEEMFNGMKDYMGEVDAAIGKTKEQFFYYSMVAGWCKPEESSPWWRRFISTHSPNRERINALLMHSQLFHETFGCKKGDTMWHEPDNFCHLLGPNSMKR